MQYVMQPRTDSQILPSQQTGFGAVLANLFWATSFARSFAMSRLALPFAFLFTIAPANTAEADFKANRNAKPRLLVLTDIGGDPDDLQSLVRLLVYANEFDFEGLIASSSGVPGQFKAQVTRPDLILDAIDAYQSVRPQLLKHRDDYPGADRLKELVASGSPQRGRQAIGKGRQTPGSSRIVEALLIADDRPLNVVIWGGQTDLGQALWTVAHSYNENTLQRCLRNLRVHDIDDQDGLFGWLTTTFDFSHYVLSKSAAGRDKREGAYRGMYLDGDESLTSLDWIKTNVVARHGPLGSLYPTRTWTAPNPHSALKEGDTPSWFFFLPNGLQDPDRPDWGGWGGKFAKISPGIWRNEAGEMARNSVARWRPYFQRDFQARMDWCVNDFGNGNHSPIAVIDGDKNFRPYHVSANDLCSVVLDAGESHDPDGDELTCKWWAYTDLGGDVDIDVDEQLPGTATIVVNHPGSNCETHVVLELTDSGRPPLTTFRRVVITKGETAKQRFPTAVKH